MSRPTTGVSVLLLLATLGCGNASSPDQATMAKPMEEEARYEADAAPPPRMKKSKEMAPSPAASAPMDGAGGAGRLQIIGGNVSRDEGADMDDAEASPEEVVADDGGGGERVREWFPESFLWQPLVETDAAGSASLDVRVPDQLTTWRVLGLGLSRDGQQAGDVLTFDSRMDIFVEPVPPGWLYAGDRVDFPIQVVNSTSADVNAALSLQASGALTGSGEGTIAVSAGGSRVWTLPLQAVGSGPGLVEARLPGHDAAKRSIPVHPEGRPSLAFRSGTLSAPRSFAMTSPAGVDPTTQRLDIQVFPGPLAMVQAEVERAQTSRPHGASEAAYSFALADAISTIAARSGADVDADAIKALQMRGWQRVAGHARSPDSDTARDLVLALGSVSNHALAESLRDVMVRKLVDEQRGDGTWQSRSNSDIQRTIVETALNARALPESQVGPRLRAAGALERHASRIQDPYTAAVVLSSGLLSDSQSERLRELVKSSLQTDTTGARDVTVPPEVQNAWGRHPSLSEARAFTYLSDPEAEWAGDVLSGLMASWQASTGFRAGEADIIALEAIVSGLPSLTTEVDVILELNGKEVARQTLDPSQPRDPAVLLASPAGSTGAITLRSEPQVPGLAFVGTLRSWSDWTGKEAIAGVDVELAAPNLRVGRDGVLTITLAAPSGVAVSLEQGLPAGLEVDESRLQALPGVNQASVRFDHFQLTTKAFGAGEILKLEIPVRPSFAGEFSTRPLELRAGGYSTTMAPMKWKVSP